MENRWPVRLRPSGVVGGPADISCRDADPGHLRSLGQLTSAMSVAEVTWSPDSTSQVMMTPVASSFPDIRSICAAGTSRLAGAHVLYGGAGPGRQAHDRPADRSQLRGSKVAVKWRRAGGSSTMR